MRRVKVFLYEFLSGEGVTEAPLDIVIEGLAMLLGVAEDFSAAGFEVFTTLNQGLASVSGRFESSGVSVRQMSFREGVEESECCLVIAPESDGILYELVRVVERNGKTHLGPDSSGIALAADKKETLRLAEEAGLAVPFTIEAKSVDEAVGRAEESGFPVVFKPSDGVGCEGVSIAWGERGAEEAAERAFKATKTGRILVQEYVNGVDASVSVIASRRGVSPLTLNAQLISRGERGALRYEGGYVPLNHEARREAFKVAEKVVSSIPGLEGYVGVDLVLSRNGVFLMEVNPRLTTSYLGVRKVVKENIARLIAEARLKGTPPLNVTVDGGALFRKASMRETGDWEVSINGKRKFVVYYGKSLSEALAKAQNLPLEK